MSQVTLAGIHQSYGPHQILEDINFTIAAGGKVALTGANGAGKTTLLRIIAGQIKPDRGRVVPGKDTTVAYLPQSGVVLRGNTLLAEAESVYTSSFELQDEVRALEDALGNLREGDPETEGLLLKHHDLQERLLRSGFYSREESIERVLAGLGFKRDALAQPVETFSSGWQMRIALAKVLLSGSDILLLDEPTNYLDLEVRTWLEDYLRAFGGGLIVVSHDRFFLDTTVEWIVEIYLRKINRFKGTYSGYEIERKRQLDSLFQRYERQQAEIERIESFIRRFRYKASKASQVQSRIKMLEKMERIEIPPLLRNIHFGFPEPPRSGRVVFRLSDIGKSFGEHCVFDGVSWELNRGEKLVVVGPNGAGKTTLIRVLNGELKPDHGELSYGKDVVCGYFSPESQSETGEGEKDLSVIETVEACAPTQLIPSLRNLLGAFLFQGDDVLKSVSVLSGGERSRLQLLKLLLRPVNLLLLDEPTNHLDMKSKDVLLDALRNFKGTLVFVSHDRYFIENLADRVLELEGGRAKMYVGDYSYFLWRKEKEAGEQADASERVEIRSRDRAKDRESDGKEMREKEIRLKSHLKKLQREESQVLERLEVLEQSKGELMESMKDEQIYMNGDRMREIKKQLESYDSEQKALTVRWESITRELQEMSEKAG